MIIVYFDGLCEPHPGGVAAYGYLIYRDRTLLYSGHGAVGQGKGMTNNVAEYAGLMAAARWLRDHEKGGEVEVRGDSQLVIMQMSGRWQVRSDTSRKYVPQIQRLLEGFDVTFRWVPREENQEADRLSRLAYEKYFGQGMK